MTTVEVSATPQTVKAKNTAAVTASTAWGRLVARRCQLVLIMLRVGSED